VAIRKFNWSQIGMVVIIITLITIAAFAHWSPTVNHSLKSQIHIDKNPACAEKINGVLRSIPCSDLAK
jgi:hypothetical protein